jgi:hypothetical protein
MFGASPFLKWSNYICQVGGEKKGERSFLLKKDKKPLTRKKNLKQKKIED